ncbi:MAG TPA: flagellar hook-length control protein FliK [Methylophilaceae bacterium]|nr:flagellar hook-length control protein FliK [Methylophilaceae bacterium]
MAAAVILPTQLSAQAISSGEISTADATSTGLLGQADVPIHFAAMLAQQLGMTAEGQLGEFGEVIDTDRLFDVDLDSDVGADAGVVDPFLQFQQGVIGLPVAPAVPAASVEQPTEEVSALPVSGQAVGAARGQALAVSIAEEIVAGRQSVAENSAAFAGQETPVFSVSSEALAEQAMRPAVNVAQAATSAAPPISGAISQPVASPSWGDVLGDRVMWMVGQQQQGAELRLNPPSLGPLEIKLSMSDGQATLTFNTQHLPVKEALEAATPRLREMFGESGINLGNVSVNVGLASQQQQGEQQQAGRSSQGWRQEQTGNDFTSMLPTAVTSLGRNGMVDFFA